MKNFREIEQLSAYLDGQLSPSDSAQVESRIGQDPELESALQDMRAARGLLRKLPSRRAPRNFTLTRQMVGLKPPLPQSFSFFRLSTAFATVLLMLTFAANSLAPRLAPASTFIAQGMGGSGGGCDTCLLPSVVAEEPAAAAEAPLSELAPLTTETPSLSAEDANRLLVETPIPSPKEGGIGGGPVDQPEPSTNQAEPVIPAAWQIILLGLSLLGGTITFLIRRSAARKWR